MLERYRGLIGDDPAYVVPAAEPAFSTARVLAMEFVAGEPIEALEDRPQDERDRGGRGRSSPWCCASCSPGARCRPDPNFANYRWQSDGGGSCCSTSARTRAIASETRGGYYRLLMSALDGSRDEVRDAPSPPGSWAPPRSRAIARRSTVMIDVSWRAQPSRRVRLRRSLVRISAARRSDGDGGGPHHLASAGDRHALRPAQGRRHGLAVRAAKGAGGPAFDGRGVPRRAAGLGKGRERSRNARAQHRLRGLSRVTRRAARLSCVNAVRAVRRSKTCRTTVYSLRSPP